MQCPIDGETLVMADRNGVEIDYCPKCRGVWLDRGELDKIVERAAGSPPDARREDRGDDKRDDRRDERRDDHRADSRDNRRDSRRDDDDDRRYYGDDRDGRGHQGKRRESFLSDLFDF